MAASRIASRLRQPSLLRRGAESAPASQLAAAPEPDRLKQFVARHYVDQKKLDAIALLQTIDTLVEKPEPATFDFNATLMFSALYQRDRSVECEETVLPLYEIAEYTALIEEEMKRFSFIEEDEETEAQASSEPSGSTWPPQKANEAY